MRERPRCVLDHLRELALAIAKEAVAVIGLEIGAACLD